jgi:hypothetical protein
LYKKVGDKPLIFLYKKLVKFSIFDLQFSIEIFSSTSGTSFGAKIRYDY